MHRFTRLIAATLLLASNAVAADGIFTLKELWCLTVDGKRGCGRGSEDFMLYQGTAYYRPDASEDWTEVGTVTDAGKLVTINVSEEGVGRLVGARIHVDVTPYITDFAIRYRGRVHGARIRGAFHAYLELQVRGQLHHIRGGGTFNAKRIGDAYPVPPPDPYFGETRTASRTSAAGGVLSVTRSALGSVAGSD